MTGRIFGSRWARSALMSLLVLAIGQPAAAQEIAGSFEQLRVLVKPGDTVSVTDAAGVETTGKIAELSSSTLILLTAGARQTWTENSVTTINQRRNDSLGNGAIYGLAIGAGLAATLVAVVALEDEDIDGRDVAIILAAYGAIGAGAGVGIDALITKRQVIYQRPPSARMQIGIAPWLTSQRKGVQVTVRF